MRGKFAIAVGVVSVAALALTFRSTTVKAAESGAEVGPETLKKAVSQWGKRFIPVAIWFRRSEGDDPSGITTSRSLRQAASTRRNSSMDAPYAEKRPLEVAGVVVDSQTIWIPDLSFEPRFVARVEVGSPPLPAKLLGTYLSTSIWVVRADAPIAGAGELAFEGAGASTDLIGLRSFFSGGGWAFSMGPVGAQLRMLGDSLWAETSSGVLLLDRDLKPVGYTGSGKVGLEKAPELWRGKEIAASPVLEFSSLDPTNEALAKKLDACVLAVRGFFRHEVEADESEDRHFRMRRYRDDEPSNELMTSGYAVGPKLILVNRALTQEEAFRLEKVVVVVKGEERSARFVGAFRRFNAFLVEIDGEGLKESLDLSSDAPFVLSQPLIALTADYATHARRPIVSFNRITGIERGYRGILEPVLQYFPRAGSILLGPEEKQLVGAILEVRRDGPEDEMRSYRSFSGIDLRLMTPSEIRSLLTEGKAAYDPRLRPRSAEREKDMVWFGIDSQPLSPELAKSHGVELATRGGDVGVIVLKVHDGSPAQRIGMAAGDILLSLRDEEESEPWELSSQGSFGREDAIDSEDFPEEIPEEMREQYLAQAGPPWRSPRNAISEKLTRIGEGKRVEVISLHDGKEKKATIELEIGPPDFESAKRFQAQDLGLTVKDLTYEVRGHYRLKSDSPGVVVAKVERGSKAAVAKVLPFEVLASVNSKPVNNVDDFQKALTEAQEKAGGDGTIELRLEKMGKSRLVRIR